ncbi:hypothetical protein F5X68DRAFT_260171 [Plectosphaerella plurivora]|uniref:Xylanolytic transcriptional activator regulatory domain-containing protein n=1 Tax=Plectosphaerella plurivora TaxID=936078 RepID=A0A9P8VDH5_9PEZI|nr:hypothetical protein F5X68DRAFT_260171 [Plectosphaerella plurivora]
MAPDERSARPAVSGIYSVLSDPMTDNTPGSFMQRPQQGPGPDSTSIPPAPNMATTDQIAAILARLSDFERRLDMVNPTPSHSASPASDIAAMRSLLVPAMQGGHSTPRASPGDPPADETPIYDSRYHQTHNDIMESVCLRRDLSRPENPPFGMWWTFTVEETLLWPILGFQGNVNSSLDAVMLGSHDGSDSEEGISGEIPADHARDSRSGRSPGAAMGGRGLDDGTVVPGLIESFLSNVHIKCPILDPQGLRAHAASLVENGPGWDARTCQVLLACALGAIASPWTPRDSDEINKNDSTGPHHERSATSQQYFTAGQKRLGLVCTQSSLTAAQCLFMAGTYFMYTQQPVAGWRLLNTASIACRTYITKRMARESMGLQGADSRSMEQRLYWSCFKAERELACEFGMETAGLNIIAYSTSFPTPPNGQTSLNHGSPSVARATATLDGQVPGLPTAPHEPYDDRSWYFFLTDIMLRKLEMRIDIYMQEKRREAYRRAGDSPELFFQSLLRALREFDYQATSYYESLPEAMQFPLDSSVPCQDELRQYLRWRLLVGAFGVGLGGTDERVPGA